MGEKGHCKSRELFFFLIRNENHQLGTGIFVHHRLVSAGKRVQCVSDRMSYIILGGR